MSTGEEEPSLPTFEDASDGDEPAVIDLFNLLNRCVNSPDIALRVLRVFRESTPGLITQLEETLRGEQFDDAARHAHSLRGAAANIGALPLSRAAEFLEHACRQGDPVSSGELLATVRAQFTRSMDALPSLWRELETSASSSETPGSSPARH